MDRVDIITFGLLLPIGIVLSAISVVLWHHRRPIWQVVKLMDGLLSVIAGLAGLATCWIGSFVLINSLARWYADKTDKHSDALMPELLPYLELTLLSSTLLALAVWATTLWFAHSWHQKKFRSSRTGLPAY